MSQFFKTIKNTVKYWYLPAIAGVLFILLGIYLFTVPLETYFSLALLFGLSFLFVGITEIAFSISNKDEVEGWAWYLVGGIFDLAIGIMLSVYPEIAVTTLPYFVGFSLLFRSFQGLGFAFDLKNYKVLPWGDVALISILGIIFSFLLIANPIITGISLVVLTASSFIIVGVYAIILSFRLKNLNHFLEKFQVK